MASEFFSFLSFNLPLKKSSILLSKELFVATQTGTIAMNTIDQSLFFIQVESLNPLSHCGTKPKILMRFMCIKQQVEFHLLKIPVNLVLTIAFQVTSSNFTDSGEQQIYHPKIMAINRKYASCKIIHRDFHCYSLSWLCSVRRICVYACGFIFF